LAWSVPIFALLCFIPVMRPIYLLIASIILSVIGMVVLCVQRNRIYIRENNLDDKGLMARKDKASNEGVKQTSSEPVVQPKNTRDKSDDGSKSGGLIVGIVAVVLGCFAGPLGAIVALIIVTPVLVALSASKSHKIVDTKPKVTEKAPGREKFMLCLKPLIGVVFASAVWLLAPNADEYYYIASTVCIITLLISIKDLIKGHNELATRKLPQFDKRGGDES